MWWIVLIIACMLFSRLDDIIKLYKSKHPEYQEKQEKLNAEKKNEQHELTRHLKELVGMNCLIESYNLLYASFDSYKINMKIINVDDDWVEGMVLKKKKETKLIIKIEDISSVSTIL